MQGITGAILVHAAAVIFAAALFIPTSQQTILSSLAAVIIASVLGFFGSLVVLIGISTGKASS